MRGGRLRDKSKERPRKDQDATILDENVRTVRITSKFLLQVLPFYLKIKKTATFCNIIRRDGRNVIQFI